jgi:hypothetical protein
MRTCSLRWPILFASFLLLGICGMAQAQELEGTWKLVMRKLPDGTTLVPPAVLGVYTVHNGLQNINVFWHTPEGNPASYARIPTYKISDTEYTETLLFNAFDKQSRARLIPMSIGNGAEASSPPQSPSVSCFGLTGPLTDRTRHFIPCWRAL